MRAEHLIALALIALFFVCTYDHEVDGAMRTERSTDADVLDLDIVQRTCALEVVVRFQALEGPLVFGFAADDTMPPADTDPQETMLACRPAE